MPAGSDMKKRASITIFMIMSLTMVMSLFFSMSEVVRYFCMKSTADVLAASAAQSGLGDYNRLLYEKYGILAVDMGYGSADADDEKFVNRVSAYASCGGNPYQKEGLINYVNLMRMDPTDTYLSEVTLLTDYSGAAFMKEASIQEVYDIPESTVKKWQEAGDAAAGIKVSKAPEVVENMTDVVASGKGRSGTKRNPQKDRDISLPSQTGDDESSNLIEAVDEFRKRGVLSQVMGSGMTVSASHIDTTKAVSKRTLDSGSGDEKFLTVKDGLLYKLYLIDHMSSYTKQKDRRALSYELEYIICGKDSDEENLRSVVKRLLALREAENSLALLKDSVRRHEAESMAAAASMAIANPELTPIITAAIIAAWAYVESVLDVRLLLSGGKVSLVKSPANWTSELAMLPEYFDTDIKARDDPAGIDYSGYMFALLSATDHKRLGLRPLDVMEAELHATEDYENVMMDNMMVEAKYNVTMTGAPLFLSLAPLISTNLSSYEFVEEKLLSYL